MLRIKTKLNYVMINLNQKSRIVLLLVFLLGAIVLFLFEKFGYTFELIEFLQGLLLGASLSILIGFLVVPVKKVNEKENEIEKDND
jgi:uncharacterized membrane protein YagU involved in acid resistance